MTLTKEECPSRFDVIQYPQTACIDHPERPMAHLFEGGGLPVLGFGRGWTSRPVGVWTGTHARVGLDIPPSSPGLAYRVMGFHTYYFLYMF